MISAYANGTCAVSGSYQGTATFGPGETNATVLTSDGEDDAFVARYAADGALAWAESAGGTLSDIAFAVSATGEDALIAAGRFRGTATFGAGADAVTYTSPGFCDFFVARYSD